MMQKKFVAINHCTHQAESRHFRVMHRPLLCQLADINCHISIDRHSNTFLQDFYANFDVLIPILRFVLQDSSSKDQNFHDQFINLYFEAIMITWVQGETFECYIYEAMLHLQEVISLREIWV